MIDFRELKKVEKKYKLFEREYKGLNYWQMVRLNLVNSVEAANEEISRSRKNVFLKNVKYCIINYFRDLRELRKRRKCDILYFDQCAYSYVDGVMKDTYFDYFGLEEEYDVYRCYYLKKKGPRLGVGVAIPLAHYYIFRLIDKFFPLINNDKSEIIYLTKLEAYLQRKNNCISVRNEVRKAYLMNRSYSDFYKNLLEKCNPKAVIVLCHYDETLFPLYAVCQDKGIPVIELQHGLAAGVNAYTYDDCTLAGKQLPSYMFTYGDVWDKYIIMPKCTRKVVVGNAFLEDRRTQYKGVEADEKKIVIYSFPDERERLVGLSITLSERLPEYSVLLKLHPREIQYFDEIEARIKDYGNLTIADKKMELYELLSSAGHHIAISSTVLYEAAIFNSRRYVYRRPIYIERMQPLIDSGLSDVFDDVGEAVRLILEGRKDNKTSDCDTPIWKTHAKENAQKAFRQIINNQL